MTRILHVLLAGIVCFLAPSGTLSAEELPNLHLVAQQGSGEEMQEELASGTALNLSDENGRTALLHSVLFGNLATAHVLLSGSAGQSWDCPPSTGDPARRHRNDPAVAGQWR